MSTRGYTILGWIVWQLGQWFARRKMRQNRGKLAAVGVAALVLVAGLVATRLSSGEQ